MINEQDTLATTTILLCDDGTVIARLGDTTQAERDVLHWYGVSGYVALRPTKLGTVRWADYAPTLEEMRQLEAGIQDELSPPDSYEF